MIDATAERFCFSDRTSPIRTSSVSAPTYTAASLGRHQPRSVPRLLSHLVGLDHVLDLDVAVTDADAALVALADLGHVLLEPAQRLHAEVLRHHDAVADQACLAAAGDDARTDDAAGH